MAVSALIIGERRLHQSGDNLCLTDLWRMAGADASKRPVNWLASAEAQNFMGFLADSLNVGISDLVTAERGGRSPATWAHWQVALAYAKYLSPELHAQCNTVWRAHIEERRFGSLPVELEMRLEQAAERGAERAAERAVQKALNDPANYTNAKLLAFAQSHDEHRQATEHKNERKNFGADAQRDCLLTVLIGFGGLDLIDRKTLIVDQYGQQIKHVTQFHHWNLIRSDNRIGNCFPAAVEIHKELTRSREFRDIHVHTWIEFHRLREMLKQRGELSRDPNRNPAQMSLL